MTINCPYVITTYNKHIGAWIFYTAYLDAREYNEMFYKENDTFHRTQSHKCVDNIQKYIERCGNQKQTYEII